jgi:hypothetical protein
MKKPSVLWLLPLAAALLICSPSALFAKGKADKKAKSSASSAPVVPAAIQPDTGPVAEPGVPSPLPPPEAPSNTSPSDPSDTRATEAKALGSRYFVEPADREPQSSDTAIPIWVLEPDPKRQEDYVIGIGSAHSSTDQLSIQMAEARARQDISFQLSTQVQAKITDYADNQGKGKPTVKGEEEFNFSQDSVTERIGQQLTDLELKGASVSKRERDPHGVWWVEVLWSKEKADKAAADISQNVIEAEIGPGPAERARIAAQQLNDQLEKAKSKPAVVSE